MRPFIYFYMPVFNEQETAGVLLYRLREVMQKLKYEYTVLLTLDGCSDETPQVIAPYLHLMPIRVVDRAKRSGYGKSLWEAISLVNKESANPKRDFFLILDAGFTQDPSLLNELNGQIERNVDFCCGNRLTAGKRAISLRKRLANSVLPLLLRLRGVRPKCAADLINTFQGFRVQLLRRNLKQLQILKSLGPDVPPSGVAMLMFLLLSGDARKFYEVKYTEKRIRRRASRFSVFRLLRFALFGNFYDKSGKSDKSSSTPRRRPGHRRKWKSNKPKPDSSKA